MSQHHWPENLVAVAWGNGAAIQLNQPPYHHYISLTPTHSSPCPCFCARASTPSLLDHSSATRFKEVGLHLHSTGQHAGKVRDRSLRVGARLTVALPQARTPAVVVPIYSLLARPLRSTALRYRPCPSTCALLHLSLGYCATRCSKPELSCPLGSKIATCLDVFQYWVLLYWWISVSRFGTGLWC
jgi:hypothetical protein